MVPPATHQCCLFALFVEHTNSVDMSIPLLSPCTDEKLGQGCMVELLISQCFGIPRCGPSGDQVTVSVIGHKIGKIQEVNRTMMVLYRSTVDQGACMSFVALV